MNYTQLTDEKKAQIDILLEQGLSMRKTAQVLGIHHSTISRYKSKKTNNKKRFINIEVKYEIFLNYLYSHYDSKTCSIELFVFKFKRNYLNAKCPCVKQVYNWIEQKKINLKKDDLCYKKRRGKKTNMMNHTKWNLDNKTVLPTSLRPKYINKRDKLGHLEIDSIIGKNNEYDSIISIVDRCSRRVWLIKSEYKQEYYTANLIYNYIIKNEIIVKSITVDNSLILLFFDLLSVAWLFDIVEDMIESTIEDNPEKVSTIIAVNSFIEQLDLDQQELEMTEIVGEKITNRIFDEIKSNI